MQCKPVKDLDQNFDGFLYKHCSIFSGKALDFHPKLGDAHFYLLIRFTIEKFNFTEIMQGKASILSRQVVRKISL